MWKTQLGSLGQGDPLEKEMAPTPVFLPGQKRLVGYSPWGRKESDTTNANCQHLFIEHVFMESLFHAKYIASSYTESTLCSP